MTKYERVSIDHTKTSEERVLEGMAAWAQFYRANINRFVEDFLHIRLKIFQQIIIVMMNVCNYVAYIASRGQGKTYLVAIFCVVRCVLYPGTQICIAAGTKGQSVNVLEKIQNQLMPGQPELAAEIDYISTSVNKAECRFHNGQFIKVVTASDQARGNRANIFIADEYRMISKDTVDTVLRRFLSAPRHPGYLDNPKYAHLVERNKEIYLTSAWKKEHWWYDHFVSYFKSMLDDKRAYFCCGLPYQIAIKEGLYMREQAEDEMSESTFNEVKWMAEMCAIPLGGDAEGTFFNYDAIAKTRKMKYAWLPPVVATKFAGKTFDIPIKTQGEIRVLSADIALMSSTKHANDATAIFINSGQPGQDGRYYSNIVYAETTEGEVTARQALRIRRLYEMYDIDYIVIDGKGVGMGVVDLLLDDIFDPDSGETYPALSCYNNNDIAARCSNPNAKKALWVVNAQTAKFNSDIALMLREGFRSGRIRLLTDEYDAEEIMRDVKGYGNMNPIEKAIAKLPYEQTTLLIDELINLKHEETSAGVRIYETQTRRKDRYSSLAYNYYVMSKFEDKDRHRRRAGVNISDLLACRRAPKIR